MNTIFIQNLEMEFIYKNKLYSATSQLNDNDMIIYHWNDECLCWKITNNKTLKDILPKVKLKLKQLNK